MPSIPQARLLRCHAALLPVLLLAPLALSACGSSSSSDTEIDMPVAYAEFGQADFSGISANRGSTVSNLSLAQPRGGIATDGSHFYVADYGNNRILGWNSIPASPSVAPDFVLGQSSGTTNAAGTSATQLASPSSVSISGGKLIVADSNNNRVLIWNTLPTSNVAASVVVGQASFANSSSGLSATQLSFPTTATIANGKLLVSDQGNNRVLIFNTVPTANGAAANVVLGQDTFTTRVADDEENGLNSPTGLWTDGFQLMVADTGNNRVLYWQSIPSVNNTDARYVIGQADFAHVSAAVGSSSLRTPTDITSDGSSYIYVADSGNNRVVKFDFPIASQPAGVDYYGQNTSTSSLANDDDQDGDNDGVASDRTLNSPYGVFYYSGNLYVSDRGNHRVMFFPG